MRLRLSLRAIAAASLALAAVPAPAQVNADLNLLVSESTRSITYGRVRTYTARLTSATGRCATTVMTPCNPFGTNTCPVVTAGPPVVREACNPTIATTARNVSLALNSSVGGAVVGLPAGCTPTTFSCSVTTATSCDPTVADACPFLVVNGVTSTALRESCDPNPFPCDVGDIQDGASVSVTFTQSYPVPQKFFCSTSGAACTPNPALAGGSNCAGAATGETCDEDPDRRWEGEACLVAGPFPTSLTATADNIAAPVTAGDNDFAGRCSVHKTTVCAVSADCPTGETCGAAMAAGRSVDVKVELSGPATAGVGQTVDFTTTVTNLGPCDATDVEVDWDPAVGNSSGMTLAGSNLGAPLTLLSDPAPSAVGCDLNPADDGAESATSGVCSVTDTQTCDPSVTPTTCPTDEECVPDRLAYSIYGVCYTGPLTVAAPGNVSTFTSSFTIDPLQKDVISHAVWNSVGGQALVGTGRDGGGGLNWDGLPRFDPVLGNNAPNTYTVVKNNKKTGCSSAGGIDGASLLALLGLTGLVLRRRRS